jgi:hypothetical protein
MGGCHVARLVHGHVRDPRAAAVAKVPRAGPDQRHCASRDPQTRTANRRRRDPVDVVRVIVRQQLRPGVRDMQAALVFHDRGGVNKGPSENVSPYSQTDRPSASGTEIDTSAARRSDVGSDANRAVNPAAEVGAGCEQWAWCAAETRI